MKMISNKEECLRFLRSMYVSFVIAKVFSKEKASPTSKMPTNGFSEKLYIIKVFTTLLRCQVIPVTFILLFIVQTCIIPFDNLANDWQYNVVGLLDWLGI
jgi:hypothetical protein